jgi:hypothetical protein
VSQQHRHAYAAGIQRGLPVRLRNTSRKFPPPCRRRCALRPALIRQVRAGGSGEGRKAPVPRVLLSATLAGPAPSGSTGHVPALSGLLPPSPPPRGSDCPQLQRPAATRRRRRSLTSTRITAPHGATRSRPTRRSAPPASYLRPGRRPPLGDRVLVPLERAMGGDLRAEPEAVQQERHPAQCVRSSGRSAPRPACRGSRPRLSTPAPPRRRPATRAATGTPTSC